LKSFQASIILEGPHVCPRCREMLQTRISEGVRVGYPKFLKRSHQQLFELCGRQRSPLDIHPKFCFWFLIFGFQFTDN